MANHRQVLLSNSWLGHDSTMEIKELEGASWILDQTSNLEVSCHILLIDFLRFLNSIFHPLIYVGGKVQYGCVTIYNI